MNVGVEKGIGTYSAYLAPRYRGDARSFIPSLRKLRALPVPDLVLPGHPAQQPAPQSPRLTQEAWQSMLDAAVGEMETLLARFEADGASFLDGEPKRLLSDLYYFGDFQGRAVYGLFAASKLYLVDAPGGSGLLEFLENRLRQLGLKPAKPAGVLLTSCDPEATAGLRELLGNTRAQVVVSPDGLQRAKDLCPPGTAIVSPDDLSKLGWFDVTPMPLRGRGVAPIAYVVRWGTKIVLFSGRIPILFDHDSLEHLAADLAKSPTNPADYCVAVNQLGGCKPDVWLPAVPSDGQNANLYDDQWKEILANNYRLALQSMSR